MVLGPAAALRPGRRRHDSQQHVRQPLVESTASPHLLGQAVSFYMLALSGGFSLGAVITGATVTAFGVQHALLMNGIVAVAIQLVVARMWMRAPLPAPKTAIGAS